LLFNTLGTSPTCPLLYQVYPVKLKLYFTRRVPFFSDSFKTARQITSIITKKEFL